MFQVPPVLGIDIGTTKVCAVIFQNGQVDVIETETGSRSVPAFVAFTDEEHLVGETAKNQAGSNLDNTIFDIKRVIGRELQEIMPEIQIWPFKFIKETQQVKVQVTYKNEERIFQPEELCALLLVKIKEIAEHQIGHTITDAVISVPALFNENQRVATLCAGKVAGLNVLRLINEPTAAALAYAFDITRPDLHHVVVYDFGASTFDVSVIAVDNKDIKVLSSNGSTKLGGKIIDHRLTQHFLQHIKATEGLDLTNNPRDMYKMMNACEKLKLMLTSAVQARVNFDVSDQELHISMDRGEFEKMNMDLFETSLVYVEQVVMDAKLKKSDISEVILVGGTTRILKIQQLLQDFFPDTSVKKRVNPDEAVACGAAIQAAITRGYEQGISSQDIATFRVMLTDNQIVHSWVLEKNKVIPYDIPAIHPFDGKFYHFFEESADFLLQEHDRSNYLGSFTATRRETRANFSVNESGICTISCKDTVENNQSKAYVKNHLAFAMIEEMSHKVMKIQEDAETRKKILAARYELERYCFKTQSELLKLKKSAKNINTDDLDYALSCISWTNNWVDADVIKPTDQYSVHRKVLEMCITNFLASFNSKVCKPAEIVPKTSTSDQMTFNNDSKSHNTSIVCSSRSFKRSNSDVDLINLQPKKSKSNVCKSLQACKEKLCILTASSTESGRDIQKSDDIINVQTDANKMEYEI